MPSFMTRVADAWDRASHHLALAFVPVVTALLNTENIEQILRFDGQHIGFKLGLPVSVVDVWQFTSVPNAGFNASVGLPVSWPAAILVIPLGLVVKAVLSAGYFGSLAEILGREAFDFLENAQTYFWQFLLYELVPVVIIAPLLVVGMQGDLRTLAPLIFVAVLAFLVGAYFFFATPYLVVLDERGLVPAAKRSYRFARQGGQYFEYALHYAGFVFLLSVLVTAVVVNLGPLGVLLGIVGVAPLGLALNLATMRFVAELDGGSPAADPSELRPRYGT